jgi:hypothetical protein
MSSRKSGSLVELGGVAKNSSSCMLMDKSLDFVVISGASVWLVIVFSLASDIETAVPPKSIAVGTYLIQCSSS